MASETEIEQLNIAPEPMKFDAKKFWLTVWEVVKWVLLTFLVLTIVFNLIKIAKSKNGDAFPMILGFGDAIVITGSMEPTIKVGDAVFVHKQSAYNVGDIVTFIDNNGNVVTHRVVSVTDGLYTTQGDANNVADRQMLTTDNICGRVLFWIARFGYFVQFMQSIWGVIIIFAIGFAIIEVPYLVKNITKKRKEQKEAESIKKRIEELGGYTNKERKDMAKAEKEKSEPKKAEKIYFVQAPKKKKGPVDDF